MLKGIRTIVISVLIAAVIGAIFGALVGVMVERLLLAVGAGAFIGANFGLALAYGYLPDGEADMPEEGQAAG